MDTNLPSAAAEYAATKGWPIFPRKPGGKKPLTAQWRACDASTRSRLGTAELVEKMADGEHRHSHRAKFRLSRAKTSMVPKAANLWPHLRHDMVRWSRR